MRRRALELHNALFEYMVEKEDKSKLSKNSPYFDHPTYSFNNDDEDKDNEQVPVRIIRMLYQKFDNETGKEVEPEVWQKADSATFAWFYLGLLGASSSAHSTIQTPYLDTPLAKSHYKYIIDDCQKGKDDQHMGISRYKDDHYFYDGKWSPARQEGDPMVNEVSDVGPPWGVTTMFTLWAEFAMGMRKNVMKRLDWMSEVGTEGSLPVGECVDHDNSVVWSSAADVYEHGGVYIYSVLLNERKAELLNPLTWNTDDIV